MIERIIFKLVDKWCAESLPPYQYLKWESVYNDLKRTRHKLKK